MGLIPNDHSPSKLLGAPAQDGVTTKLINSEIVQSLKMLSPVVGIDL